MSRSLVALDRTVIGVLGLVLLALGALGLVWQLELVDAAVNSTVDTPWLTTATEAGWWPWAVGAAGVVLALLGLRWLVAHVSRRTLSGAPLPGSGRAGRLTADMGAVAEAAAESVADTRGVRSVAGRAIDDRGRRTVQLTLTLDPTADLSPAVEASERVARELAQALPEEAPALRVHLHTARRSTAARTVA